MAYSAKESYSKKLALILSHTKQHHWFLNCSNLIEVTSLFLGKFPPPRNHQFRPRGPTPMWNNQVTRYHWKEDAGSWKANLLALPVEIGCPQPTLVSAFWERKKHLPTWNVLEMSYSRKSTHFKLTWSPKRQPFWKKKLIFQPCLFLRCYSWKLQEGPAPIFPTPSDSGGQQSLGSLRPDHLGDPWVPINIKKWTTRNGPNTFFGGAMIQSWCEFFIGGFEWFPENPRNLQTLRTLPEPMDPYNLDDPLEVRINGL